MDEQDVRHRLPVGVRPLEPGDPRAIGGHPLLGRVGRGGMGTVYLAEEPGTGRPVAIKTVHPRLAADPAFRARFRDEVRLAGRVASFCTAQVLTHGEQDGVLYMVSEYVGGVSLARRIAQSGPLPHPELHGVAVGVATALAAIHAGGLAHCDLKPENVLLTLSGPRVIDFGIARALDTPAVPPAPGTVLGTPGWIAPEVLTGVDAGPAADVFAWGCLVLYAGTGRPPFGGGTSIEVARRVVHGEPDLTGAVATAGPLLPLIEAALAKAPADRPAAPQLMLALVGELAEIRPRRPGATRPPGRRPMPSAPGGRGPERTPERTIALHLPIALPAAASRRDRRLPFPVRLPARTRRGAFHRVPGEDTAPAPLLAENGAPARGGGNPSIRTGGPSAGRGATFGGHGATFRGSRGARPLLGGAGTPFRGAGAPFGAGLQVGSGSRVRRAVPLAGAAAVTLLAGLLAGSGASGDRTSQTSPGPERPPQTGPARPGPAATPRMVVQGEAPAPATGDPGREKGEDQGKKRDRSGTSGHGHRD
ncbi:serine/threonine-protein kinase [Actinomadura craniellae]|uniref:serine/threonine-protein kinase n=1 Tax=Actinomadura craniellae TaxID=2231787 RepID=UPI00131407FD|nr:serine/threonine-protein kinase [Actinomadura craniellae]